MATKYEINDRLPSRVTLEWCARLHARLNARLYTTAFVLELANDRVGGVIEARAKLVEEFEASSPRRSHPSHAIGLPQEVLDVLRGRIDVRVGARVGRAVPTPRR